MTGRKGYLSEGDDSLKNFFIFARNIVNTVETDPQPRQASNYRRRKSNLSTKLPRQANGSRRPSNIGLGLPSINQPNLTALKVDPFESLNNPNHQIVVNDEKLGAVDKSGSLSGIASRSFYSLDSLDGGMANEVSKNNPSISFGVGDLPNEILIRKPPPIKQIKQTPGYRQVMNISEHDTEEQRLLKLLKVEYLVKLQKSNILHDRLDTL
jgi:hypothetical protein